MSPRIIPAIIFICLIQGNTCTPTDDILVPLISQIASIKTNVDHVIENGAFQIRQSRTKIAQILTEADTAIHGELDQLDNIVLQAEQEAQQINADISHCLNEASSALSNFDINRIHNCSSNTEMNLLGIQFGNLRVIKKDLSNCINICLGKNPHDLEKLTSCVQSDIDLAKLKADEIQEKIESVCEEGVVIARTCIEIVVRNMDSTLNRVAHSLKDCLSIVLSTE